MSNLRICCLTLDYEDFSPLFFSLKFNIWEMEAPEQEKGTENNND